MIVDRDEINAMNEFMEDFQKTVKKIVDDLEEISAIRRRIQDSLDTVNPISISAVCRYNKLLNERFSTMTSTTPQPKENKKLHDFGWAIGAVKEGHKVTREGWNGKDQHIELATGISYYTLQKNNATVVKHKDIGSKAIAFVGTRGIQLGWLASQADMLAEDWHCVEEEK